MPSENTSLKNTTPAGDSSTTNEMVIGKINTYQRSFLIVAGSLLALLVWITVAGTGGVQHLQSSAHEITKGAVALADYQVDSANSAFTKDIFGLDAASENQCVNPNGQGITCAKRGNCSKICCGRYRDTNCCMCKEYCDKYADCSGSDLYQFHTSGCCCCRGNHNDFSKTDCVVGDYCACGSPGCPKQFFSF